MRVLGQGSVKAGSYVTGPQGGIYQIVKVDDKTVTRLILNDVHGTLGVPLPALGRERVRVQSVQNISQSELRQLFGPRYANYSVYDSFAEFSADVSELGR